FNADLPHEREFAGSRCIRFSRQSKDKTGGFLLPTLRSQIAPDVAFPQHLRKIAVFVNGIRRCPPAGRGPYKDLICIEKQ
ncbi:hypothetical protein NZA98_03855, partial [Escherichia coli]|nr:hypothetical protein [Escherichia coli]